MKSAAFNKTDTSFFCPGAHLNRADRQFVRPPSARVPHAAEKISKLVPWAQHSQPPGQQHSEEQLRPVTHARKCRRSSLTHLPSLAAWQLCRTTCQHARRYELLANVELAGTSVGGTQPKQPSPLTARQPDQVDARRRHPPHPAASLQFLKRHADVQRKEGKRDAKLQQRGHVEHAD